ncbi:MAG: hypothetical protein HY699_20450 [Deltaproteobacteria bacterium]|nr:hypothetical protein [Deltaproteobacteria bacterium]
MKKLIIGATVLAAATLGSSQAFAATACLTNMADPTCVLTKKCGKEILALAKGYVAVLQGQIIGVIDANLAGKNKDAAGKWRCVGGTNDKDECIGGNNGYCKDGARKSLPCRGPEIATPGDTECPGHCKITTATPCSSNGDCPGGADICVEFDKGCVRTKGCNPTDVNDTYRCELQPGGIWGSFNGGAKNLLKGLNSKCSGIDLTDLGLPTAQCKGKCRTGGGSGGTGSFEACASNKDCHQCKIGTTAVGVSCTSNADCSSVPGSTCATTSGGECIIEIDDVADCITQGMAGDMTNGIAADANTRTLTKLAYLTRPTGAKTSAYTMPTVPRRRTSISLPNLLQIAVKSKGEGSASAGGATPMGIGRCQGAGARNGSPCIKDGDCDDGDVKIVQAGGTAYCGPDCCACTGAGTCGIATSVISSKAQSLCTASGQIVCELRGNQGTVGNLLNAPTAQVSNGIPTCLVTRTGRIVDTYDAALEATDKGHCYLGANDGLVCNSDTDCPGGTCEGGLSGFGGVNLDTGAATTKAPIETTVYLGQGPNGACPTCQAGACDSGSGTTCSDNDGDTSGACLPSAPAPWTDLGVIPNPFDLNTGTTSMTASAAVSGHDGWPGGSAFCGACSGASNVKNGCPTDGGTPCAAGSCVTSGSELGGWAAWAGFRGNAAYDQDATTSAKEASASGIPDNYAPVAAGMFCTGITGNPLVDKGVGLPGPVRVVQPQLVTWTFGEK